MSATQDENTAKAVANQDGEVGSHIKPTGPLETGGHQPGKLVGNDKIPEHNIEVLPAGTAPRDKSFKPQGDPDYNTNHQRAPTASETLTGSDSSDVHTGLGHPGSGMSSQELRHDGKSGGGGTSHGSGGSGLQGVGAETARSGEGGPDVNQGKRVGVDDVQSGGKNEYTDRASGAKSFQS